MPVLTFEILGGVLVLRWWDDDGGVLGRGPPDRELYSYLAKELSGYALAFIQRVKLQDVGVRI